MITIDQQIRCAERELAMRRNVYARRVADGRMGIDSAYHETNAMVAIIETLEKVKRHAQTGERIRVE